jgi:hypothetical protein
MRESRVRFIRQLGFVTEAADERLYVALMLQPRIVGAIVALGILLQSPWIFLALAALLLWSAMVPALNPFDALYNVTSARRRGLPRLGAAPPPRRFAAGMAGAFVLGIALALLAGAVLTARVLELVMAIAIIQVVFRDECAGAKVYHLLHRHRTAPSSEQGVRT